MSAPTPMIRFDGVVKALGGRTVLDGVSFAYPAGPPILAGVRLSVGRSGVAVIHGDSGIGKTTLLNLLAGLSVPSAGTIERPSLAGFVFQDDRLLPWRTNAYNVSIGLRYRGFEPAAVFAFSCSMIEAVGLGGRELDYPDELSGGMKKRVAFARCFAALPNLVLMDEPFSGLHRSARKELWALFVDLLSQHPVPVVIVTHFPEEVPRALDAAFYRLESSPASLRPTECTGFEGGEMHG